MDLFTLISAQEFEAWNPALKVMVHDHPRRFASLKLGVGIEEVAISWRSDLIEPVVLFDELSHVWVGVDQRVICITLQGVIMFSIGLGSLLLDIKRFPELIVILCDAEVITVNLDYSIRAMYRLNDIPSTIEMINGILIITFADGGTQTMA